MRFNKYFIEKHYDRSTSISGKAKRDLSVGDTVYSKELAQNGDITVINSLGDEFIVSAYDLKHIKVMNTYDVDLLTAMGNSCPFGLIFTGKAALVLQGVISSCEDATFTSMFNFTQDDLIKYGISCNRDGKLSRALNWRGMRLDPLPKDSTLEFLAMNKFGAQSINHLRNHCYDKSVTDTIEKWQAEKRKELELA